MVKMHFALFFLIFFSIYFGMHYYTYSRVSDGLELSQGTRNVLKVCFLAGALSFVFSEIFSRHLSADWLKPVIQFGFVWLGVMSISITVFFLNDILRYFFTSPVFKFYSTMSAIAVILVLSAYSVVNGLSYPVIKEIKLKTTKLPANISNFTIVQLSDIHINLAKPKKDFEHMVSDVNSLNPDLIVITGDMIDADLTKANHYSDILSKFKSKYGVYACTGNHEFYAGVELFESIAEKSNIIVLRNRNVNIGDIIELAGVDDKAGRGFGEQGDNLTLALANIDHTKPVVLMSHQPDLFKKAQGMGVDLQLSGHTHAGQIPPLDLIEQFIFKFPNGLYKRGESYIYTTVGTGYWGPPMRLFSRSEIVKIVLEK